MKSIYVVLIAVASLAIGFVAGRHFHKPHNKAGLHLGAGWTGMNITPYMVLKVQKGTAHVNDNYYTNILTYNSDSNTIGAFDTICSKNGYTIAYGSPFYILTASRGTIDSVAGSVWKQNTATLVDTTIYSRLGVIYGKDATGATHSFSTNDIISMQGGAGCIIIGILTDETYNATKP
jgi:hypothetical protein